MKDHSYYMELALEEARRAYAKGEVPIGAVLVIDDKVVAKAHNTR
ncbi:MAG: deaminase, partial [Gemella haemolysans]|nr:deaminase [Gemella haemolysans]